MAIESTPDSGVEIKNAEVAALFAPDFLMVTAVGITEHEQRGRGIPNNEAFITEIKPLFPKCFFINAIGINTFKIPASKKPPKRYGEVRDN